MYASLTYRDLPAALTWLQEAFGFDVQPLDDHTAVVRFGTGTVLLQLDRPADLHGSHLGQGWVYTVIADVDRHYRRAAAAGAQLLGEPHHMGDDHRGYSARDPEGNLWSFGSSPVP